MKKLIKDSKALLFENMLKLNSDFKLNESINLNMFNNPSKYKQKAIELKTKIDELIGNEEYEIIDTLYRLIVKRTSKN
jgi:hypothetical protein